MQLQTIEFLVRNPRVSSKRVKPAWLYTIERYRLYWHHSPKNAGTFFKSLLYYLDHGRLVDLGSGLHDRDCVLRRAGDVPLDQIERDAHNLIIMRKILTPELKQRLKEIYKSDFRAFRQVRGYWRDVKKRGAC